MNELKHHGTEDILIAVVDGPKAFPEAMEADLPKTLVRTGILQLIRYSLSSASWKERKTIVVALKPIYQAAPTKLTHLVLRTRILGPDASRVQGHAETCVTVIRRLQRLGLHERVAFSIGQARAQLV